MGLVEPDSGEFTINGRDIYKEKNIYEIMEKKISHVPQNIYLLDRSIIENIVLGHSREKIELKELEKQQNLPK